MSVNASKTTTGKNETEASERPVSVQDVDNRYGFVKFYRTMGETKEWKSINSRERDLFITILMKANVRTEIFYGKNQKTPVKPGQWISSNKNLADLLGDKVSPDAVRRMLVKLAKAGLITYQAYPNKYTIITVSRWADLYTGTRNIIFPAAARLQPEKQSDKPKEYDDFMLGSGIKSSAS